MSTTDTAAKAIAEYNATEVALADLRTKYADAAFDLTTVAGNKAARAARLELVTLRTTLEKKRKELKEPALEYSRRIDSEAKRITAAILELESPIDEQIKADEARREREKAEREAAERARVETIVARLEAIKGTVAKAAGRSSVVIQAAIESLKAQVIDDSFEEFRERAEAARTAALNELRAMHARVVQQEEEARRVREEREALRREREAQEAAAAKARAAEEAAAAERRRLEDEARAAREAELKAEADRLAREREAFEQAQREQAAREAAARAEQEAAERKEREAREAKERAEREAREAEERAARQREAQRLGRLQAAAEQMHRALTLVRASGGFSALGREAQEAVVDALFAAAEPDQQQDERRAA